MIEQAPLAYYCIRCESDRGDGLDIWKPILQVVQEPNNHAARARAIAKEFGVEVSVYLYGRAVGRDYATFGEGSLPLGTSTTVIRGFAEEWGQ
jgi:hypothetical protein